MRATIFTSSSIQFVMAFVFLHSVLSLQGDVYGEGLATGAAFLFAIAVAVTNIPAIAIAAWNRWLSLGFVLSILIPVCAVFLFVTGS